MQSIRVRLVPYAIVILLAMVLSLLPPAIFADFLVPFESWDNWYGRGQPHPRPHFTGENWPPMLRREFAVYSVLAAPPSWLRERVRGYPTVYWGSMSGGVPYEAAGPPFAFAIEHLAWALPLWFVVGAVLYELLRAGRQRLARRRAIRVRP